MELNLINNNYMRKFSAVVLFAVLLIPSALYAYSEQTQECLDRMSGHVLKEFPTYDYLKADEIQSQLTQFCLTTQPSQVSSVANYSEFTELGRAYWDMLEKFTARRIVQEYALNKLWLDNPNQFDFDEKELYSKVYDSVVANKKTIQEILADDLYYGDTLSAAYRISQLVDREFQHIENFLLPIINSIKTDYNCDPYAYMCTLKTATVTPVTPPPPPVPTTTITKVFSDVSSTSRYYGAIKLLKDRGIVSGYPDGSFGPLNSINRAEFLTILMRNVPGDIPDAPSGGCGFSDVKSTDWYAKFICFAKSKGYAKGYPDGTFGPEKPVSLVEALALTERIFGFQITEDKEVWYRPFVVRAADRKLIPISIGSFDQKLTRQEMADMIVRFISDKENNLEQYLKESNGNSTIITYDCLENQICLTQK